MLWLEFMSAGVLFLITHRVPTIPFIRAQLIDGLGERGFMIIYSSLSLVIMIWWIVAAGRAPYVELWEVASWQYWAPNIIMPFVCIIIAFSIAAPNPLSIGGSQPDTFDPDHPGFAGIMRHGLLWALALWSGSHIIPNGNLAHVLLFGSFFVFSLYGMRMIDRRQQRKLGMQKWLALSYATSLWPFQSLINRCWQPSPSGMRTPVLLRLSVAVALYAALLALHASLIGVSPLPLRP